MHACDMVRIGLLKIMTMFFYLYWRAVSELRRSQIQSVVVVAIGMWSSRSELLLCRCPRRGGKEAGEGDLRWRACPCQIWSSVVVHAPPVPQDLSPWPAWIHGRSDTFWPRLIHGRLRLIPIMSPQSIDMRLRTKEWCLIECDEGLLEVLYLVIHIT